MKSFLKSSSLYLAWTIAVISMLGSLYFSNVLHDTPCVLCWYQRIMMYPLVLIIGIEILWKHFLAHFYALPLAVIGLGFAIYQNLLIWNIIPEKAAPCVIGTPCTDKVIDYFGFITLPFLSMLAFAAIITLVIIYWRLNKNV